jgi:DNA-binding beta-propeller fold protein YncE
MRLLMRRFTPLFVLLVLLGIGPGCTLGQSISQPLALDRHPRGDLYVLSANGALTEISLEPRSHGRLRPITSGKNLFGMQVSDVVAALVFNEEQVFVSGESGGHARIYDYDLSGNLKKTYDLPTIGTGFDIDTETHLIYVASSLSNEIFRINMTTGIADTFTRIKGAESLGPVVINTERKSLYVADQKNGVLYEANLATGSYSTIATRLGEPTGLAFDAQFQILYIAEAERGRVFRVDTKTKNNQVTTIETHLSTLTGVAPGPVGNFFVSDRDTNTVYYLNPKGIVIEKFSK